MVFEHRRGRDRLFIVAEILEIAMDGSLKTQIMYRANLSFTQLNDYLNFMLRISLLEITLENDKDTYRATDKGVDFLQRYREITELLKTEEEEGATIEVKEKRQTEGVRDGLA
jgi:predicted transcriptional regulator